MKTRLHVTLTPMKTMAEILYPSKLERNHLLKGTLLFLLCGSSSFADSPTTTLPLIDIKESDFSGELSQFVISFVAIVCFLVFLTYLGKRVMYTRVEKLNETSRIKIVEQRTLSPKSLIYLVEIHGQFLIIGESSHGLTGLGQFSPPQPSPPVTTKREVGLFGDEEIS